MAKHMVKCKYCSLMFDTNSEPSVQIKNRYAHKHCYDKVQSEKTQDEKDYEVLENYIKKIFDIPVLTVVITKQIKTFREEYNFTYTGIQKTLQWYKEVENAQLEDYKIFGIAIVPYIYDKALEYYKEQYIVQQNNKIKLDNYKYQVDKIIATSFEPYQTPSQFFPLSRKEGINNEQ